MATSRTASHAPYNLYRLTNKNGEIEEKTEMDLVNYIYQNIDR